MTTQADPSLATWERRSLALALRSQAFIDGAFVDAKSGETFTSTSARNGATLARVASCDVDDVDDAVRAARRSYERGTWCRQAPRQRKRVLLRIAQLISENHDELALLDTLDMGKPICHSRSGDVVSAIACIEYFAEAIDKQYGAVAPTPPGALGLVTHEPFGVVGAVVPWNYPLLMAAWKLGPALAVGNSVVLKPAEQSPFSALRLAELAADAGLPDGVLNVVPGFGETAGQALGRHMDVDKLAFTGSTEIGKLFLRYSGESNMKSLSLECGGKSPHLVLADTEDLDRAARAVANGIFTNSGQVCNAGSRLIVDERIRDELLDRLIAQAATTQVGDPLDPAVEMGPVVDETQLSGILADIERGIEDGATIRIGGRRILEDTGGAFVGPTILDDVRSDMAVARKRDLRAGAVSSHLQRARSSHRDRERHHLRSRGGGVDRQRASRAHSREPAARRHRVGELL
jgi:acyl-CoA reductase-like NAD-dependent aldehyde dehydrogenase